MENSKGEQFITINYDIEFKDKDTLSTMVNSLTEVIEHERDIIDIVLFFSFDIVNSSKYKAANYSVWFLVLDEIFHLISDQVQLKLTACQPWRSIGDEIVFIQKVLTKNEVENSIEMIADVLANLVDDIKTGRIYDTIGLEVSEIDMLKTKHIVIKSCCLGSRG